MAGHELDFLADFHPSTGKVANIIEQVPVVHLPSDQAGEDVRAFNLDDLLSGKAIPVLDGMVKASASQSAPLLKLGSTTEAATCEHGDGHVSCSVAVRVSAGGMAPHPEGPQADQQPSHPASAVATIHGTTPRISAAQLSAKDSRSDLLAPAAGRAPRESDGRASESNGSNGASAGEPSAAAGAVRAPDTDSSESGPACSGEAGGAAGGTSRDNAHVSSGLRQAAAGGSGSAAGAAKQGGAPEPKKLSANEQRMVAQAVEAVWDANYNRDECTTLTFEGQGIGGRTTGKMAAATVLQLAKRAASAAAAGQRVGLSATLKSAMERLPAPPSSGDGKDPADVARLTGEHRTLFMMDALKEISEQLKAQGIDPAALITHNVISPTQAAAAAGAVPAATTTSPVPLVPWHMAPAGAMHPPPPPHMPHGGMMQLLQQQHVPPDGSADATQQQQQQHDILSAAFQQFVADYDNNAAAASSRPHAGHASDAPPHVPPPGLFPHMDALVGAAGGSYPYPPGAQQHLPLVPEQVAQYTRMGGSITMIDAWALGDEELLPGTGAAKPPAAALAGGAAAPPAAAPANPNALALSPALRRCSDGVNGAVSPTRHCGSSAAAQGAGSQQQPGAGSGMAAAAGAGGKGAMSAFACAPAPHEVDDTTPVGIQRLSNAMSILRAGSAGILLGGGGFMDMLTSNDLFMDSGDPLMMFADGGRTASAADRLLMSIDVVPVSCTPPPAPPSVPNVSDAAASAAAGAAGSSNPTNAPSGGLAEPSGAAAAAAARVSGGGAAYPQLGAAQGSAPAAAPAPAPGVGAAPQAGPSAGYGRATDNQLLHAQAPQLHPLAIGSAPAGDNPLASMAAANGMAPPGMMSARHALFDLEAMMRHQISAPAVLMSGMCPPGGDATSPAVPDGLAGAVPQPGQHSGSSTAEVLSGGLLTTQGAMAGQGAAGMPPVGSLPGGGLQLPQGGSASGVAMPALPPLVGSGGSLPAGFSYPMQGPQGAMARLGLAQGLSSGMASGGGKFMPQGAGGPMGQPGGGGGLFDTHELQFLDGGSASDFMPLLPQHTHHSGPNAAPPGLMGSIGMAPGRSHPGHTVSCDASVRVHTQGKGELPVMVGPGELGPMLPMPHAMLSGTRRGALAAEMSNSPDQHLAKQRSWSGDPRQQQHIQLMPQQLLPPMHASMGSLGSGAMPGRLMPGSLPSSLPVGLHAEGAVVGMGALEAGGGRFAPGPLGADLGSCLGAYAAASGSSGGQAKPPAAAPSFARASAPSPLPNGLRALRTSSSSNTRSGAAGEGQQPGGGAGSPRGTNTPRSRARGAASMLSSPTSATYAAAQGQPQPFDPAAPARPGSLAAVLAESANPESSQGGGAAMSGGTTIGGASSKGRSGGAAQSARRAAGVAARRATRRSKTNPRRSSADPDDDSDYVDNGGSSDGEAEFSGSEGEEEFVDEDSVQFIRPVKSGVIRREITKAALRKTYHLPINEAAAALNIGVTVLKKYCRKFRVPRWPYRKLQSMAKLIESFQRYKHAALANADLAGAERCEVVIQKLYEYREEVYDNPDKDIDENVKKLRQANFKIEYRQRQGQHPGQQGAQTAVTLGTGLLSVGPNGELNAELEHLSMQGSESLAGEGGDGGGGQAGAAQTAEQQLDRELEALVGGGGNVGGHDGASHGDAELSALLSGPPLDTGR